MIQDIPPTQIELVIVWVIVFATLMTVYRYFKWVFDLFSWLWFIFLAFNISIYLCEFRGVKLPQTPITQIPSKLTEMINNKLMDPFKGSIEKLCESDNYSPKVKAYCISIIGGMKETLDFENSLPNLKNFVISQLEKTCVDDVDCINNINYLKKITTRNAHIPKKQTNSENPKQ
jgi:hypothetical protein